MQSMLIDSHAHLPANTIETEEIIKRAAQNDVVKIINIGTTIKDSQQALKIANQFETVYASVGVYPNSDQDMPLQALKQGLKGLLEIPKAPLNTTKLVAIGECGIDITKWQNQRPINQQIELFEMQIELAIEHNLPLIIHNRNGDEQVINTLQKYKNTSLQGVAHCFDGAWKLAQTYLDLNFYISFSGFITHNSKKYLLETVQNVPLDKFLVETDSPYIVPKGVKDKQNEPKNGRQRLHFSNEPKNVKMVAQKVADTKNMPATQIYEHSYENTCKLFKI